VQSATLASRCLRKVVEMRFQIETVATNRDLVDLAAGRKVFEHRLKSGAIPPLGVLGALSVGPCAWVWKDGIGTCCGSRDSTGRIFNYAFTQHH